MKSLSARSVKQRLTRAGVDWRALSITEQTITARKVDIHFSGPWQTYTEVRLAGPKDVYDCAYWALFYSSGLSVADYPDYSLWCRR